MQRMKDKLCTARDKFGIKSSFSTAIFNNRKSATFASIFFSVGDDIGVETPDHVEHPYILNQFNFLLPIN